ncbi:MAG: hypothetical protein WC789_08405 [Lentisphaeria bacterium]|jgi:hypothetical protein
MDPARIFEAIMLLCFGAAWPFSIFRLLKTQRAEGKSVWFLLVILAGYAAGILHKLTGRLDGVIALYILNLAMVSLDLALCLRYKRRERQPATNR